MKFYNLARMTSATTGTGTLTLGSAVSGFLSFADAGVTNGSVVYYSIRDGANSEVGRGTYTTAGTTLSRDTVYESTNGGAKISCSGTQEVFITALAENLNLIDPYGLHHRLSGSHADDDEFDTDTSASYSAITPTGTANWAIGNHCLTCQFNGQSSGDIAAYVKPLTLADGEWLETSIRLFTETVKNYTLAGLVLTNGTLTTSGIVTANMFQSATANQLVLRLDGGTVTAISGSGGTVTLDSVGQNGAIRLRLKRTNSTTYSWELALENGYPFYGWGAGTFNPSITPTHGGVFVSTLSGTHKAIAAFDYLRHMS